MRTSVHVELVLSELRVRMYGNAAVVTGAYHEKEARGASTTNIGIA